MQSPLEAARANKRCPTSAIVTAVVSAVWASGHLNADQSASRRPARRSTWWSTECSLPRAGAAGAFGPAAHVVPPVPPAIAASIPQRWPGARDLGTSHVSAAPRHQWHCPTDGTTCAGGITSHIPAAPLISLKDFWAVMRAAASGHRHDC